MRVLLTGATGAIGGAVLLGLIQGGHEVVAAVRNIAKAQALVDKYGAQLTLVELDASLDLTAQFQTVSRGFDRIIHTGFANSANEKDSESAVLQGLLNSAKETSESKPVSFIFTTGVLILGEQQELSGEDQTSSANTVPLVAWRVEHEETTLNANTDNLHTAVVRPGFMYGGSTIDFWFNAVKKHGKIVVPNGNGRVAYIHKEDLGTVYRLISENLGTGLFNAVEGAGPSVDEVVEIAKEITGVQVVEKVDNVWQHIHDFGFFIFGLTLQQLLDPKRARELYGFVPKHSFQTQARELLLLE